MGFGAVPASSEIGVRSETDFSYNNYRGMGEESSKWWDGWNVLWPARRDDFCSSNYLLLTTGGTERCLLASDPVFIVVPLPLLVRLALAS